MTRKLILKEVVERIRKVSSEETWSVDWWLSDEIVNYLIEVSDKRSVEDGVFIIKVEIYMFKFKFEHLLNGSKSYYNQLISFSESEQEVYKYDPYTSTKKKRAEVL